MQCKALIRSSSPSWEILFSSYYPPNLIKHPSNPLKFTSFLVFVALIPILFDIEYMLKVTLNGWCQADGRSRDQRIHWTSSASPSHRRRLTVSFAVFIPARWPREERARLSVLSNDSQDGMDGFATQDNVFQSTLFLVGCWVGRTTVGKVKSFADSQSFFNSQHSVAYYGSEGPVVLVKNRAANNRFRASAERPSVFD